jgi:cellulose synthase/poly-beta-1,6-N-acetylglucosamine synthase-like glycosyltransferase
VKPVYKPSIFIAMPNMGTLATGHTQNLLKWFLSGKYRLTWFPLMNKAPLDRARNECHKAFLESTCDYLFFLDADTVPPIDTLDQLLAADKDMISATVQTLSSHKGQPQLIPVAFRWNTEDPDDIGYKAHWGRGVEEVDIATLACTLIKRKVMEKVGKRAFQYVCDNEWGTDGYSEDFYFSRLVREKGFMIWNHYGILCSHIKEFDAKTVNALLVGGTNGG